MSNVRQVMCHAEFVCSRCLKSYTSMALAPVVMDRIAGDAVRVGDDTCNDCRAIERNAENEAYKRARKQRDWVRKHSKAVKR